MRNRIADLRGERAWTQADLAQRIRVSRQSINAIETGMVDPSLIRPARHFDRTIEDIVTDEQCGRRAASVLRALTSISVPPAVVGYGCPAGVRSEPSLGYFRTVGFTDTARAKAQAAVSKAEADVASVRAELNRAKASLEGTTATGGVLDSLKDVAVVGSLTSGLRDESAVDQAKAKAEVDRLTAELKTAESSLDRALKAQAALHSVIGDS